MVRDCIDTRLQEGHVIDERPVGEAGGVAQVAQIVAVAPQLLHQLRVAHLI